MHKNHLCENYWVVELFVIECTDIPEVAERVSSKSVFNGSPTELFTTGYLFPSLSIILNSPISKSSMLPFKVNISA